MATPLDQLADCLHDFESEQAFCINDRFYSYLELQKIAGRIQQQILEEAPRSSSLRIGVLTYHDIETYASLLAILFLGHTFVPLNPSHPADRNRSIAKQADIKIILTSNTVVDTVVPAGDARVLCTTGALPDAAFIQVPLAPMHYAYILFTSGSTGAPKGVPVTVDSLNAFLDAFFAQGYTIDHRDKFLQMFDLTFDLSLFGIFVPLCIGACIYPVPFDAIKYTAVYKLLEKYQLTVALLVPSILASLRRFFEEIELPALKYSLFCGEGLHEDLAMEWVRCIPNAAIHNTYGPTEATIFCMLYPVDKTGSNKTFNGILSIGKPMKHTQVTVVDENLNPVTDGEKGELCLSGSQVTPGYIGNEMKNNRSFFNLEGSRFYRTGDVSFVDADGDYFFSGRLDFQVKINGFRVELSEIEFHAGIALKSNAVAALVDEKENGATICLFAENPGPDFDSIRGYLKTKLPAFMVPSKYIAVKQFPLNANGKLDRSALLKMIG